VVALSMHIACWTSKATNTPVEYVILIAFPLQQWLVERASMIYYILILIYFSTAVGLTLGGSTHLHLNNTQNITINNKTT
jgi:hypothetical protein